MKEPTKKREKRYITDIGKDSDDLILKLQSISGNKKMSKKDIVFYSLDYCNLNKIKLKESQEKPISKKDLLNMQNTIIDRLAFFTKDVNEMIRLFNKFLNE